jgi:hypothetical protein
VIRLLLTLVRLAFMSPALLCAGLALFATAACSFTTPAWASEAFGIESFATSIEGQNNALDVQAGSHPYAITTTVLFDHEVLGGKEHYIENLEEEEIPSGEPEVFARIYGNPRHLQLNLPPGLVVDPNAAVEKCSEAQLETNPSVGGGCPAGSAVGVVTLYLSGFGQKIKGAVYDMQPPAGVPAELAIDAAELGIIVHVLGRLRSDGDYGFSAEISEITQSVSVYGLSLTLWGEPSSPSHDPQRGICASRGPVAKEIEHEFYANEIKRKGRSAREYRFDCPASEAGAPLLTLPGSCTGQPLDTTLAVDSWQNPEQIEPPPAASPALTGCEALSFNPSLNVAALAEPAATTESPSGLNVELSIPQDESPGGLATAEPRAVALTLPPGLTISPSVAGGLGACTATPEPGRPEGEIALHSEEPVACPNASKLGEVQVDTPLLSEPLTGGVYLAQPQSLEEALAESALELYLVAEGDGVLVKFAARATLDPLTGQISLSLGELPQLPLSSIHLTLFPGPRAALQTPANCGAYTTTSQLTPWSGGPAAEPASTFSLGAGCGHPFAPSLLAGTSSTRAGAPTSFSATISRANGEQQLAGVHVLAPPGLLATLGSVAVCSESQVASGTCPASSEIGQAALAVGPGPDPYWVAGKVYLTGPYEGAPFGLLILAQVSAGPLPLGQVQVRARVEIDPHTAQLEISSDPLPSILGGVPLDIRTVNLTIDRPGFMFAPTDCAPLAVTAALSSTAGQVAQASSPFEATGCSQLPFKPTFAAYTDARTSRTGGASISMRIDSGPGQIDLGKVRIILPTQLAGRLSTLQKACPFATFNAGPAACPADSVVGSAQAVTRVLAHPLSGPAYLVSHGGIAFPDIVFVLRGEGVTMYLDGNLDIKGRLTSATFNSIPDVPLDTFAATFPEGQHSILAAALPARAHASMCGQSLYMPVEIAGQDGAQLTHTTRIVVTGCPRHPAKHKRHQKAGGKQ